MPDLKRSKRCLGRFRFYFSSMLAKFLCNFPLSDSLAVNYSRVKQVMSLERAVFNIMSLRNKITLWSAGVAIAVFTTVILLITHGYRERLFDAIYKDLLSQNASYMRTIQAILSDRAQVIMALRDDLELYEVPAHMWLHIAAHTNNRVFNDPEHGHIYEESFARKLDYYRQSGQLSGERFTPQLQAMLSNIEKQDYSVADGIAYYYIGYRSDNPDPVGREYDGYQDSSLWVPHPDVDEPYDPLIRPWYLAGREAGRNSVIFTEPYAERRTGEALISAATSITVEGVRGSLAGAISIEPIMEELMSNFRDQLHITIVSAGADEDTEFVSSHPQYIYSSRDPALGDKIMDYDAPEILSIRANADVRALYDHTKGQRSGVLEWQIGGSQRLVAFNTVPDLGWKIFTSAARSDVLRSAQYTRLLNTGISSIGALALISAIFILTGISFRPLDTIRREMRQIAQTGDLSKRVSVKSDDEVGQMARAINEMLDNVAGPVRELGLQAKCIADGKLGGGATTVESKGDIAQLVESFNQMNSRLIDFEKASRAASPLTGLPGGFSIEREVQNRFDNEESFVFCMFDLDNFKPFNDLYGYSRGNLVIKKTAKILQEAVEKHGGAGDFCGHIGGDDFVVITDEACFKAVCEDIIQTFDSSILSFYDEESREAGSILSKDRQGNESLFSIMTITACVVFAKQVSIKDFVRLGEIAAELKKKGKTIEGSILVVDRRETS